MRNKGSAVHARAFSVIENARGKKEIASRAQQPNFARAGFAANRKRARMRGRTFDARARGNPFLGTIPVMPFARNYGRFRKASFQKSVAVPDKPFPTIQRPLSRNGLRETRSRFRDTRIRIEEAFPGDREFTRKHRLPRISRALKEK